VHAVRQHFFLDGQDGITNPVGMLGSLLEVDVHVVHGVTNRMQNSVRLVRNLNLEVNEIVFTGLASALAMLTSEQKEIGALVVDLGGGTTNYVLYANGVIKHTGVFAIGGDHVSNDLGHGLKVPLSRAEKLKLEFGTAVVPEASKGRTITICNELNLPIKTLSLDHLQRIMALRLEELLQIIRQDLEEAGVLHYVQGGVFLCGGGARIPQIAQLAGAIFQAPVSLGQTNSISGLKSAGVSHGHRAGQIRLHAQAQARAGRVFAQPQNHFHAVPAPTLTPSRHEHEHRNANARPGNHRHAGH
jgi:cell division protein FtsA